MVTLDDVAAEAGVHSSTVSRTLSRPDLVNRDTFALVSAAADRLGYVPNRAARQLAGGRTATIGVLVPDLTNPFFSSTVRAVQRRAAADGRMVLLVDSGGQALAETEAVASLRSNVDGIVVCSPTAKTGRLLSAAHDTPLVFLNRRARSVSSVVVDQERIVGLALEHLQSLGHERIGIHIGPSSYWSTSQRCRHLDLYGRTSTIDLSRLDSFAPTFEGGKSSLDTILDAGITAVAAFNDVMALGVIAEAATRDIAIPEDLSIVGSDGVPFSAMSTPGLTTISAPVDELGECALTALDGQIVGRADGSGERRAHHTLGPALIIRSSTCSPRMPANNTRTRPIN